MTALHLTAYAGVLLGLTAILACILGQPWIVALLCSMGYAAGALGQWLACRQLRQYESFTHEFIGNEMKGFLDDED